MSCFVGHYLHADIGTDPATGKPTLAWSFDQAALEQEAATDGWYALLTNLPADIDPSEVLRRDRRHSRRDVNIHVAESGGDG